MSTNLRTGGKVVVDALTVHGVDTVFCVPGESYLPVLDALHDAPHIKTISCRQEGGAANMAEAYGKLTGRPGVLLVTRGPGACNASIGVHTAHQDSTPMVVLIGQVARDQEYREAFQEVDYRQFYAPLCKWVAQVDQAKRLPELLSQAFYRARAGRPGPVALALPEDMLSDLTDAPDTAPYQVVEPGVDPQALQHLSALLADSQRPLMIVGGGGWSEASRADIEAFARNHGIPTGASFRCQDRFDNHHDHYVGDLGLGLSADLRNRVEATDLLITVGARLGEITTQGYALIEPPCPKQKLVHVHPDPNELGRVYQPTLPICASVSQFARAARALSPVSRETCTEWLKDARSAYLEHLEPDDLPGDVQMGEIMGHLRQQLAPDAILTTDAGNFSGWMHRHYQYGRYPSQLGPTNGAMGYGIPAAIAARLHYPNRTVVGFCGDGGALMSGQEIATAMAYGIDPIILVINNGMYGTIRMHQERHYPTRVHATDLCNPDFAAWARSFGAHGETVEHTREFPAAFERSAQAGTLAVIELKVDPEMITTKATLSQIRGFSHSDA